MESRAPVAVFEIELAEAEYSVPIPVRIRSGEDFVKELGLAVKLLDLSIDGNTIKPSLVVGNTEFHDDWSTAGYGRWYTFSLHCGKLSNWFVPDPEAEYNMFVRYDIPCDYKTLDLLYGRLNRNGNIIETYRLKVIKRSR